MGKCRITVIRKLACVDLKEEYFDREITGDGTCGYFNVGDEFIYSTGDDVPKNFCAWAWSDINRDVEAIANGANFDWIKQPGTNITCCTDGLEPVVFKIERIE